MEIAGRYNCMICREEICTVELRTITPAYPRAAYKAWAFTPTGKDVETCEKCGTGRRPWRKSKQESKS